jgi:hypothetical protein
VGILTWLGDLVLGFLWSKVAAFISKWVAVFAKRKQIDTQEAASVVPLKDATTAAEIDNAAKNALDGL